MYEMPEREEFLYTVKILGRAFRVRAWNGSRASTQAVNLLWPNLSEEEQKRYPKNFLRTITSVCKDRKATDGPVVYPDGYSYVRDDTGYVRPEHKVVMEKFLGRKLRHGEAVHHANGVKTDNHPENLELWVRHHPSGVRARDIRCPHCGKWYYESR